MPRETHDKVQHPDTPFPTGTKLNTYIKRLGTRVKPLCRGQQTDFWALAHKRHRFTRQIRQGTYTGCVSRVAVLVDKSRGGHEAGQYPSGGVKNRPAYQVILDLAVDHGLAGGCTAEYGHQPAVRLQLPAQGFRHDFG